MATFHGWASLFVVALCAFGCAQRSVDAPKEASTEVQSGLEQQADKDGCRSVEGKVRPIVAAHLQDPSLVQTAGKLTLRVGGSGELAGTALATIVGQDPDGTKRGNHHLLFKEGILRTQNDRVGLTPTSDPCVFDASTELYVVDGTKAFQGLTGTLKGAGKVNFCGDPGSIDLQGKLCRAP